MNLLDIPVGNWSDWVFNQLGVAIGAIAVCIFLYKMYVKSLASKDEVIKFERTRILQELDEAQRECGDKDKIIIQLQKDCQNEQNKLHDKYGELINEMQKEQNDVSLRTVEALTQTTHLIEGAILNKINSDSQKTHEAINVLKAEVLGKIESIGQKI